MSTVLKLEDYSASDLLRTLVGLKTAKIIQVLPTSGIRPNEGCETRDYLVIYEQAPALGTPAPRQDRLPREQQAQPSALHSSDKFLNLADVLRTLQECTAGSAGISRLIRCIHDGEIGLPTYEQIATAGPAAAGKPGPTM